jgi:hypothetical protein
MTPAELEQKFAAALRRELGMDGPSAPATPAVSVTLAPPTEPVEVLDVGRANGAYQYRMRVTRDANGLITDAVMSPERFVPLGAFKDE